VIFLRRFLLQGGSRWYLEPSDQRARGFLVHIVLTPYSLVHAHKVFAEMSVRT
jgi:hypothetical protein